MLASGSKEAYWDALELDCASKVARHRHYGRCSSVLWAVGIGIIAQAHGHSKSRETCGALLASGSKGACWDPLELDPISESPRWLAIGTTAEAHRDCGNAAM
jgi:hypothetical protein